MWIRVIYDARVAGKRPSLVLNVSRHEVVQPLFIVFGAIVLDALAYSV